MIARIVAVAVLVGTVASSVGALVLLALSSSVALPEVHGVRGWLTPFAVVCGGLGALITLRLPRSGVGWLLLAAGVCASGYELAEAYAAYALVVRDGVIAGGEAAAWIGSWLWVPTSELLPVLLLLVFPDGRLPSPRWRTAVWYGIFALVTFTTVIALVPGPLYGAPTVRNPVSPFSDDVLSLEGAILPLFAMFFVAACLGVFALIRRFRRSRGVERQQLKWISYASVLYAVGVFLDSNFGESVFAFQVVDFIGITALPIAAGIAVFRYRLYDIDVLIKRTLVYGALTVTLGLVYVVTVLLSQRLLNDLTAGSDIAVAGSTLLVVALFQPIRARVQDVVDRRFYRARYDAARTIDAFSVRLRHDVDLDSVRSDLIGVVHDTVHPAHASVWLRGGGR